MPTGQSVAAFDRLVVVANQLATLPDVFQPTLQLSDVGVWATSQRSILLNLHCIFPPRSGNKRGSEECDAAHQLPYTFE